MPQDATSTISTRRMAPGVAQGMGLDIEKIAASINDMVAADQNNSSQKRMDGEGGCPLPAHGCLGEESLT